MLLDHVKASVDFCLQDLSFSLCTVYVRNNHVLKRLDEEVDIQLHSKL